MIFCHATIFEQKAMIHRKISILSGYTYKNHTLNKRTENIPVGILTSFCTLCVREVCQKVILPLSHACYSATIYTYESNKNGSIILWQQYVIPYPMYSWLSLFVSLQKSFKPTLPSDTVISFYVQGQKLILAVYQLYINQASKLDIGTKYQVCFLFPWNILSVTLANLISKFNKS